MNVPTTEQIIEVVKKSILSELLESSQYKNAVKSGKANIFVDHEDPVVIEALKALNKEGFILSYTPLGTKDLEADLSSPTYSGVQSSRYQTEIEGEPEPLGTISEQLMELEVKYDEAKLKLLKQEGGTSYFDVSNSILLLNQKEIIISTSKNSKQHYILQAIFSDKHKLWDYDAIAEYLGSEYTKEDWNLYYQACRNINEKIAAVTTVRNFLEANRKTVNINSKYL